jgi:nitrogen fixation-related uncharacterized protein
METDLIFPATWFVLGYLALLIVIIAVAAYWARTHGQLDDTEAICRKVFHDGVPDAQSETGFQSQRSAR